ncbi:hypothetical protein T08_947 [Trichinella sp. T8]|nr:hypothetical protein T08_947 [Trichinella sp. T8]
MLSKVIKCKLKTSNNSCGPSHFEKLKSDYQKLVENYFYQKKYFLYLVYTIHIFSMIHHNFGLHKVTVAQNYEKLKFDEKHFYGYIVTDRKSNVKMSIEV